jgi:hypothetical protein
LDKGRTSLNADELNQLHQTLTNLNAHWHTHIALEEDTVGPKNARTCLTSEENVELVKKLAEHGQAHAQPIELVMPFIVYNLVDDDRTEFTRLLPPVMVQQLMPFVWKEAWEPMKPFLLLE